MSPSRIHCGELCRARLMKHCASASAAARLGPESEGDAVGGTFRDWVQREQMKRLHRAVLHRRDSERTHLAVTFGYVYPSQGTWPITSSPERQHGLRFGLRGGPGLPVHTRRPFALVLRHSPNGQGFPALRADQHPLQDFRLAPSAVLPRLHDTRLQTPHPSMALRPVDVLPSQRRAGARVRRQTLCYAVLRRGIATILVKKDRAEVSSLSREVMSAFHLNPYPPRYRPAFASSAFPYPHPRQPSSRSACPTRARIRAYHVPPE